MDKVQFNQQVVGMRKVIKQVKVRVIHQLTRQIQKLQKKSGSAQQVEKNKRRADRLGAEIEYIKKFSADEVTKAAINCKKTVEDVCKQPDASARDRAMARLANYGHIQSKVSQFKDMVESEFFKMGKRKSRKIKKEAAEARFKKEEEDDQEKSNTDKDSEEDDSDGNSESKLDSSGDDDMAKDQTEDQGSEESESADVSLSKSSAVSKKTVHEMTDSSTTAAKSQKSIRTNPVAVDLDEKPVIKRKSKSSFFASGDVDDDDADQDEGISSGEDKLTSQNLVADFKGFASEMKTNESIKDFLKSRTAEGKKTLDSVFMGRLSEKKPRGGNQQRKQNRAGQRERQRKGKMKDPTNKNKSYSANDSKQTKPPRKVPMVDRPNVVRPASSAEKMVPGINCFRNKMNPGKSSEMSKQAPKASEKLHPSWEAKRKKKEQEAKPVAFEGKKITFDDD
ncbi:uncharacterized protein [Amphiura filiformis]|uniref:uncharacterized protein n=1 Tax=Amphiura filiformis TaxID=82378 RepID=UPI003B2229DA